MKNTWRLLLLSVAVLACGKKDACDWRLPFTLLQGYDSVDVDTLYFYQTEHDNFNIVLDSTRGKGHWFAGLQPGIRYVTAFSDTERFRIYSNQDTRTFGWKLIIPATADTFYYRSTKWKVNHIRSNQEETYNCASPMTEIEVNGVLKPVAFNSSDYGFYFQKQ